jgi:cell division GTPase FtsZ
VKPADRGLNIFALGLGQAGGNLATEFSQLGYGALALNTAHTDLSSLAGGDDGTGLPADRRLYVGIDGYDGAGSDLNYGRECINENAEKIRAAVERHAASADVVLLTAGFGGGTGSALSQLVEVLEPLELPLLTLATLPNDHESALAKVNAVRGVSELVKAKALGWIFVDNSRLTKTHGDVPVDHYFEEINRVILEPIDALNRLNNRTGLRAIRAFDGEDLRTLLLCGGVLNLTSSALPALNVDALGERVRELCYDGGVMPTGFALDDASYLGIVIEAPESVLSTTPFSTFERLGEQLKADTRGAAIYFGVYQSRYRESNALVRVISATSTLPQGIKAMVEDARREGGALREKLAKSVSSLDLGEVANFDLLRTNVRTSATKRPRRRIPAKPNLDVETPGSLSSELPQRSPSA